MFGPGVDEKFVNSAGPARRGEGRLGTLLLLVLVGGLGAFLWWASWFEIEESARGPGRVVPSQQVQVVQSLDGGILRALMVAEGDRVAAGDSLLQIDDTAAGARRGELLEREAALLAEHARLLAEAGGAEGIAFPEGLAARAAGAIAAEEAVFASRRAGLAAELRVLDEALLGRRAALGEAEATLAKLTAQIAPLAREVELTRRLTASGAVTEVELLRLETQLAALEGEKSVTEAALPRLAAAIDEATAQIEAAKSAYVLTARERLARVTAELAVLREALREAEDRVNRTTLRAPTAGVVNTVHVTTLGAVVSPAAPLIEIVPSDDHLVIEARITPRDVAFIRPGDAASVKITAFDFATFGALEGTVTRIGADALTDENGVTYFKVEVETAETALGGTSISPGMVAQVDITTGQKTVLDYLLNPFLRVRQEALSER